MYIQISKCQDCKRSGVLGKLSGIALNFGTSVHAAPWAVSLALSDYNSLLDPSKRPTLFAWFNLIL